MNKLAVEHRRKFIFFNIIMVSLLLLMTIAGGFKFWFRSFEAATGIVTKVTPKDHALVYCDYDVDGVIFHHREGGNAHIVRPGDRVNIFYATDDPGIATYDSKRFSIRASFVFVGIGSLLFTVFIWTVGPALARRVQLRQDAR